MAIFGKTDDGMVCNKLTIKYGFNSATGKYEGSLTYDRNNNSICKSSYFEYGERPEVVLSFPDIHIESAAHYAAMRHLTFFSHRHDTVSRYATYADGYDLREGDMALITDENGVSRDGNGYIDEKFILVEKAYMKDKIKQLWWRVRVNMDYAVASESGKGLIIDGEYLTIDSKYLEIA